jgi:hypothetical protein
MFPCQAGSIINKGLQEFIASAFANWTEAEIVAIEDQMMGKLEELAEIETHKYTYPVSRTEFGKCCFLTQCAVRLIFAVLYTCANNLK